MTTNKTTNKASNYNELVTKFNGAKLTGYIWMVEDKIPNIYNNEIIDFSNLNKTGNPHNKIQEAYLTDGKHSIHIKNIDGILRCYVFAYDDFNNTDIFKKEEIKYPSHKFKDPSYKIKDPLLVFDEVYKLHSNEISEGYKTWQPIVRLFKGFENTKKA